MALWALCSSCSRLVPRARPARRQPRQPARAAQGFSGQSEGTPEQRAARQSRTAQLTASEVLAELMVASDVRSAVRARVGELNEAWFAVVSTYVSLAQSDGEPTVVAKLNEVYAAAVEEKEKTLKPEIRLLNQLLRTKERPARALLLAAHTAELVSDGGLFFTMLVRLTRDIEAQPASSAQREATLTQLRCIAKEAREHRPRDA